MLSGGLELESFFFQINIIYIRQMLTNTAHRVVFVKIKIMWVPLNKKEKDK